MDEEDGKAAEIICQVLNENGIKAIWLMTDLQSDFKGRITLEFEIPNIEGEEERIIDGKSDNLVHDS